MSLVPNTQFRQGYRASHRMLREPQLNAEAQAVLHKIYTALLRLFASAKHYTDIRLHGTMKLTTYFALLMYCCISKKEKLMVIVVVLILCDNFRSLRFTVWAIRS